MSRLPSERLVLLVLAAIQFTHIMDFMVLMPLAPQLMRELDLGAGQFSALVAAYSIAAGIVGLLSAPFIDRFDRRTLLLGRRSDEDVLAEITETRDDRLAGAADHDKFKRRQGVWFLYSSPIQTGQAFVL